MVGSYISIDEYHRLLDSGEVMKNLSYNIVSDTRISKTTGGLPKWKPLSFEFNGTDFSKLITVEKVERPIAGSITNYFIENSRMNGEIYIGSKREMSLIKVKFNYPKQNLTAMRRLLSRLLITESLGHLTFSDESNVFYLAKIQGLIELEEFNGHARGEMTFIVPDSVGYSVEHVRRRFNTIDFVMLENNGTDYAYPIYDFTIKSRTYMLALSTNEATYQFGEALEQAPDKTVTYKITEQPGYVPVIRQQVIISDEMKTALPEGWGYYDIGLVRNRWSSNTGASYIPIKGTQVSVNNGTVKVAMHAKLWQTGEKIADWVKGRTFVADAVKNLNQSRSTKAYRLKDGSTYLGWLLEQDIEGQGLTNKDGLEAVYGNPIDSKTWYGPAIKKDIKGKATNWQIDMRTSFKLSKHSERGLQYFALVDDLTTMFSFEVSADKDNRTAQIYIMAYDKGLRFTQDPNNDFFKDFEGLITAKHIDGKLTLEIRNTMTNKMISQTWSVNGLDRWDPERLVYYTARYPNKPVPEKNFIHLAKFTGFNAEVWVDPDDTVDVNEKQPRYIYEAGDQISLDMNTNKAYVNGLEMLNPVAHASKPARIPPGSQEVVITAECEGALPSLEVNYREVYK